MEINLPISPPVNNNIQGNIYDRLDAVAFEKVRVANSLLESRRSLQEKIINKYRKDVERVHIHQKERLKREVRKIRKKKPDYVFDEGESTVRSKDKVGRPRALSDPGTNCSFCRRYYSHHFNVKDESRSRKKEQDQNKLKRENDHFNMTLRLFFLNMMNHAREKDLSHQQHHEDDHDRSSPIVTRKHRERVIKPHSYDPRFPHQTDGEVRHEPKRSQSVETWIKEADEEDEICDELRDLHEYPDETDVFSNSLNTSKFSQASSGTVLAPIKPKLVHSINYPNRSSIPDESRMDTKGDKDLWKRSKTAFDKIFAGLL